jgi:hypothetical protein
MSHSTKSLQTLSSLQLRAHPIVSKSASLLVFDDMRVEISGKLLLVGVYPHDIVIPSEPFLIGQLHFFFNFRCGLDEIPKNLAFEVTLPKQKPVRMDFKIPEKINPPLEGRKNWIVRHNVPIFGTTLHAGKIGARVIADETEIDAGGPWIVLAPPVPQAPKG